MATEQSPTRELNTADDLWSSRTRWSSPCGFKMEKYRTVFTLLAVLGVIVLAAMNYWYLKPAKIYTLQLDYTTAGTQRSSANSTPQRDHPHTGLQLFNQSKAPEESAPNNTIHQTSPNITAHLWISDDGKVHIYGRIRAGTNYSVYSSTTDKRQSMNYFFDLPLSALAWNRAGFNSIIILVVTSMRTLTKPLIQFVMSKLLKMDSVIVVLEVHPDFAVMVSQVSRLFVHHFLTENAIDDYSKWDQTYLVTSDADLWPIKTTSHRLPPGMDIVSFNAYCCGTFTHKGQAYMMLPIGNIGMRVKTWHSVTRRRGFFPTDVDTLVTYFSREFGEVAENPVQKGGNLGWFLDQRMISILVHDWGSRDDNSQKVRYVSRDVTHDRIDRAYWKPITLQGIMDSHILDFAYESRNWQRMMALIVLMYERPQVQWCQKYVEDFNSYLLEDPTLTQ